MADISLKADGKSASVLIDRHICALSGEIIPGASDGHIPGIARQGVISELGIGIYIAVYREIDVTERLPGFSVMCVIV